MAAKFAQKFASILAKHAVPVSAAPAPMGISAIQYADSKAARREARLIREEAQHRKLIDEIHLEKGKVEVQLLRQKLERGKVTPPP
ncbi:hypothetical protein HOY80DRAFT_1032262 [Tuber brumale]|nr:hypothetical protein HOY80DRAFT_1032262 [Tuber brumale]